MPLDFETFIRKATEHGLPIEERKSWSQKHDFCAEATIGKDGVCAALAAVWLQFRHDPDARAKTLDYFKTQDGREEVMALAIEYMTLKKHQPLADHLNNFGYKFSAGIPQTPDIDIVKAALQLPGYYLIKFDGEKGSHEIAVDQYCFAVFDPNHGEIKLRGAEDLAAFVKNLVRGMYKGYNNSIDYIRFLRL